MMLKVLRQAMVVARRDFMAMVATPTFLLFLLAPMFMIVFGAIGGSSAEHVVTTSANKTRIVALATAADGKALRAADEWQRRVFLSPTGADAPPQLEINRPDGAPEAQTRALFARKDRDYVAVLHGPLDRPTIVYVQTGARAATYLATLAELSERMNFGKGPAENSRARIVAAESSGASVRGKQASGFFAVFAIFILTLMLAGQAVGMLAEEKSNKVIEILAAAVPLEAVFLGKLIGMFGVALLFVLFWAGMGTLGVIATPAGANALAFAPAVGLVPFLILCALYFTMAYLLLGAVFLGVGAQASSIREIQMLSLPITIFQVLMFGLSSAAAASPESTVATIAEVVPFSSPFAMAARAATDASLWPHGFALAWQLVWVGIMIWISARLFRIGVLKAGGGPIAWLRRRFSKPELA